MKTWIIQQNEGKPTMTDWQRADFKEFCKLNPTKQFRLQPLQSIRSLSQNNYYWVYLGIIARETGNQDDDLHEFFKQKLLPKRIVKIKGREGEYEIEKYQSTTEMNKTDFSEYLDKICALVEVPLPDPEEAGYYTR